MPGDRVALVYRGSRDKEPLDIAYPRLVPVAAALADVGFAPESAVYDDEWADEVRDQLLGVRGALVWVDPVVAHQDRTRLDVVLREVAAAGIWVSAHPDVIAKMATKEVLFRTKQLGWGSDTYLYTSRDELAAGLPARLAEGPRVLKVCRGNGGIGVMKVELVGTDEVLTQGARDRGETVTRVPLAEFLTGMASYFSYGDGPVPLVDQPFQPRIAEGMIRGYLVRDSVVGFARQYPAEGASSRVFGLPSAKTMYGPDEPSLQKLRGLLEREWVPAMQASLGLETSALPVLWDADFLLGPLDAAGDDTYVLAEINASSVAPFPTEAVPALARAVRQALPAT